MSTLRLTAFLFSALALSACSGANLPLNQKNSNDSGPNPNNDSGPMPNNDAGPIPGPDGGPGTCVAAGGQCVAITPSSCQSGTWGDAHQYSCGSGVGVGCCLKHPPPVDGGPEPTCASIGGTCTPGPSSGGCVVGAGHLGPATSDCVGESVCCIPESACGGTENVACCMGSGGPVRPTCDSATSTQFTCGSPYTLCDGGAGNSCQAAGGQCVGITPSSCQNGTWGDANQYSCGGGIGVGCCLPGVADAGHD